jgi:nucleoside-diphosphate-sugar epimerase
MKRVLVTGATGFVGRHCPPALVARGYEVHAVVRHLPDEQAPDVRWHQADLSDEAQTRALIERVRPTHLLHLAWYAVPGQYWTSTENLRWVRASLTLFEAFAASGGRRVVAAGTCAEYDWRYGYCVERVTPLAPTTVYGTCKHALQRILAAYADQANLSAAWGRLFFLYGPHEHESRLVASVIRAILRNESAHCSHGRQVRDFLYTLDAADAFAALLDSNVKGALNIASGRAVSLREVVGEIATQLSAAHLVALGAVAAPADEPPLLVAAVNRLTAEVGWQPQHDLSSGLAATIDWWRAQLAGKRSGA